MRTAIVAVLLALLGAGCSGNLVDRNLKELAAKPPATDFAGAKALYDEVNDLINWHDQPGNSKMTQEQLKSAEALRDKRFGEMTKLGKDRIGSAVKGVLGSIGITSSGNVSTGGVTDWLLGTKDPRLDKFASPKHKKKEEQD